MQHPAATRPETVPVRKPDRCKSCNRPFPACRQSCSIAVSTRQLEPGSKCPPANCREQQLHFTTGCILLPVLNNKESRLSCYQQEGRHTGGKISTNITAPSVSKHGGFCNDYLSIFLYRTACPVFSRGRNRLHLVQRLTVKGEFSNGTIALSPQRHLCRRA